MSPEQRGALRRLTADLGVGSGGAWRGLLLGAAMIAVPLGISLAFYVPLELVTGVVVGFGYAGDGAGRGKGLAARVHVDDREALVRLPPGEICRDGDDIDLWRSRALLGYRYAVAPRGCVRPALRLPGFAPG